MQVTAYGRQTVLHRAWSGHVTHYNFWGSNHITGTAEPKVVKCCTQVGYINSSNRMTYHPLKGCGYGHVTVLNFAVCLEYAARRAGLQLSYLSNFMGH